MSWIESMVERYIRNKPINRKVIEAIESSEDMKTVLKALTCELRKKEEALEKSEAKYRNMYELMESILDAMPGIVWGKDLEGRFILTNKTLRDNLLGGCSVDDALGKTATDFANVLDRGDTLHIDCERTDAIVVEDCKAYNFIERGILNNTKTIVRTSKAPLFDKTGTLIGTVGFGRNITEECKVAFSVLNNIEDAAKTCPGQCVYAEDVHGILAKALGILHNAIATTCDAEDRDDRQR